MGSVTPLPLSTKRSAELYASLKIEPSVAEYRALADCYADAVQHLQIAVAHRDVPAICSARLSLALIIEQTMFLNEGLKHALQALEEESRR